MSTSSATTSRGAEFGQFAAAVYVPDDIVEVRCLPSATSVWMTAAELANYAPPADQNVYVGANPRKGVGGTCKDDVAIFRCVFADVDNATLDDFKTRLQKTTLPPPSLIISSGGGIHAYWRLQEPIVDPVEWTARQKGIIKALGSDKVVHDPPRIMRLPGTLNHKRGVFASIIEAEPSRLFPGSSFPAITNTRSARAKPVTGTPKFDFSRLCKATREFLDGGAPVGERNASLFKAACDMAGCGFPQGDAESLLIPRVLADDFTDAEARSAISSAYSEPRSASRPDTAAFPPVGGEDASESPAGSVAIRGGATLSYSPDSKRIGTLIIRFDAGGAKLTRLDIASEKKRAAHAKSIVERHPELTEADLVAAMEELAVRLHDAPPKAEEGDSARKSQAAKVVELLLGIDGFDLFHSGDGDGYVTVPSGDHLVTMRIESKAFREWASHRYYEDCGRVPGGQGMQEAIGTLLGIAKFSRPQLPVFLRIASHEGVVWLDLCDEAWRVVRIDADGWQVIGNAECPVRFVRRPGMESLPTPEHRGSVDELRPLVNLADDTQWTLMIGWLVSAFRPDGPYGVLSVSGEQGSAKSSLCKLARRLIDPSRTDLRRPPKNERDVFIAAGNSWICSYNNVSGLRPEISDALCALATDGGFATRTLYANDDETIFSARRPVIINGIEEPASRSDLVDRSIGIHLPVIPEDKRLDEEYVHREFEKVRPRVLGALLTSVSSALRNRDRVKLPVKPRMADLATWVTAAEEGLGWREGRFLSAYMGNRDEANVEVVESSVVGHGLVSLVKENGPWSGTATQLLERLMGGRDPRSLPDGFPGNGKAMASLLRRLAPNLRAIGMHVELPTKGQGRQKRRVIHLDWVGKQQPARAAQSAADDGGASAAHTDEAMVRPLCEPERPGSAPCWGTDDADHADRSVPPQSDRDEHSGPDGEEVGEWTA